MIKKNAELMLGGPVSSPAGQPAGRLCPGYQGPRSCPAVGISLTNWAIFESRSLHSCGDLVCDVKDSDKL